jgi:hypothetical protein
MIAAKGASGILAEIPKTESGEKGLIGAESSICENRQASKYDFRHRLQQGAGCGFLFAQGLSRRRR